MGLLASVIWDYSVKGIAPCADFSPRSGAFSGGFGFILGMSGRIIRVNGKESDMKRGRRMRQPLKSFSQQKANVENVTLLHSEIRQRPEMRLAFVLAEARSLRHHVAVPLGQDRR